jgi:CBS domain containing-hemolysin-like protein
VYEESIDNIIGILYVKDLLKYVLKDSSGKMKLADIVRPAYFIPESKMISELFEEIREKKNHFAVVLDEYGGTSGIVTAEDIIEEIVGEIEDEFDASEGDKIVPIGPGQAKVDARIDIEELNEEMGLSIPEDGDFESLGGFLASEMGKIPQSKDTLEYENAVFRVLTGTKRKILWVEVTRSAEVEQND